MDILQRFVTHEPLTGLPNYFFVAAVAALGAIIGSFLNVVIHRVPREESVAFPASHCPSCDTAIRPYDNIPVISWAVLRGRCRSCRAPISARYPAVELLTGALFALTYLLHSGLTLSLPFDLAFVAAVVALVFIDAEHMLLPNVITYPGAALALVARAVVPNLYGVAVLGALIGSFLNVVIHRVPREESIAFPASHCPSCATAIRPYDNIPVVSWAVLRGRCRSCRSPISARYPGVELLTAALFALTFLLHSGLTLSLPFDLAFVAALVALVFIDAEHMILPDVINYPGFALALVARAVVPNLYGVASIDDGQVPAWLLSLGGALLGALVGGGFLWLVGWLWERFRGVEAMGLGDVKMMFMVGAYLGWPLTLLTIFVGVLGGSVAGVAMMARRGERDMQMLLPFGIFLGLGALLSLFFGRPLVDWYMSQF